MSPQIGQFVRGLGVLVVGVIMAGWFVVWTIRRAQDPQQILFKWIVSIPLIAGCIFGVPVLGPFGVFVIIVCAVGLSAIWTPHIGAALAKPITSIFDGGSLAPEPRPLYSVAQTRQKQGKYLEAVAEIRKQLERFPTDLEGHLMLAQIQAEDLNDMPAAEITIQRLCAQPGHVPKNIAFALYSLADWHLAVGHDQERARRALEQIVESFPDTEFALGAAQRIAHLGGPEQMLEPHERKKFSVTVGARNLGLRMDREKPKAKETDPERLAEAYVKHLEEHPLDMEAREQLAILYADHYRRLDLATSELEQMIAQPKQPSRVVNHLLNLLADLQIRGDADYETVRSTLERIAEREPNSPAAEIARKRIDLVRLELKGKEKTTLVKLGIYEQKIGLKHGGAPRRPGA